MSSLSLAAVLSAQLSRSVDKVACVTQEGALVRYSDLIDIWSNVQTSAAKLDLDDGRRIALLLPTHIGTAAVTLALAEVASVLPVNPALTIDELSELCIASGVSSILCVDGAATAQAVAERVGLDLLTVELDTGLLSRPAGRTGAVRSQRPAGLVLFTSGSTGEPKRVPLTMAMLMQSARTIANTLRLGPDDRAAHLLPTFHIGALVDLFLAPLMSGGSIALSDDRTAQGICDVVLNRDATWVQLVPTMLAHAMASLDQTTATSVGKRLRFVRSVSADLSPALQERAETMFGVPLIQMYGMTESAGQITSNPLPPAVRKAGTVGRIDGAELAILDPTGSVVAPGAQGEVCIRGASVMKGYEDTDLRNHFHAEWFRTGDIGCVDADGYLSLIGRRKQMINRGGEKISPIEIERVALAIPGIQDAAAYALAHRTLGEIVGLTVTLRDGSHLESEQIKAALAIRLAEHKLPRDVRIARDLPRLASGKIDRVRLRADACDNRDRRDGRHLSALAITVSDVWRKVLRTGAPADSDDFFECGGDSLSGIEFVLELERRTGRRVTGNVLFETPRFAELIDRLEALPLIPKIETRAAAYVRRQTAAWAGRPHRAGALILGLGTVGPKKPFFFSSQGSDETRTIREIIDRNRPLYVMRSLFGLVPRSLAEKHDVADGYAAEICEIQPQGPVFLGGFCEGGEMAAMTADALLRRGRTIGAFASIDYWFSAPTSYPVLHVWTDSPIYSPSRLFRLPETALPVLHPAGARIVHVDGDHRDAIDPSRMQHTAHVLEGLLDGSEDFPRLPDASIPFHHRAMLHGVHLDARLPRLFRQGVDTTVAVEITNRSRVDWPAPELGGPCLKAQLIPPFAHKTPVAGFSGLPASLKQDETVRVYLRVTPFAAGLMRFVVGMTDDGFCDFGPKLAQYVWVTPAAA